MARSAPLTEAAPVHSKKEKKKSQAVPAEPASPTDVFDKASLRVGAIDTQTTTLQIHCVL